MEKIKLTESEFKSIVKNTVKKIVKESIDLNNHKTPMDEYGDLITKLCDELKYAALGGDSQKVILIAKEIAKYANGINDYTNSHYNSLEEDMSLQHGEHTYDQYLDDNDFMYLCDKIYPHVTIDDFTNEEYKENLITNVENTVRDFVDDEAIDVLGYKYGNRTEYRSVAEHIVNYLEKKIK